MLSTSARFDLPRHTFHSDGFAPIHRACWGDGCLAMILLKVDAPKKLCFLCQKSIFRSSTQQSGASLVGGSRDGLAVCFQSFNSLKCADCEAGVDPELQAKNGTSCMQLHSCTICTICTGTCQVLDDSAAVERSKQTGLRLARRQETRAVWLQWMVAMVRVTEEIDESAGTKLLVADAHCRKRANIFLESQSPRVPCPF